MNILTVNGILQPVLVSTEIVSPITYYATYLQNVQIAKKITEQKDPLSANFYHISDSNNNYLMLSIAFHANVHTQN